MIVRQGCFELFQKNDKGFNNEQPTTDMRKKRTGPERGLYPKDPVDRYAAYYGR